jgi:hypothetical protein
MQRTQQRRAVPVDPGKAGARTRGNQVMDKSDMFQLGRDVPGHTQD